MGPEHAGQRSWVVVASAGVADTGFDRNVSRVSFSWGSEKRVLQEVHFQRWMQRLPK